MAKVGLGGEGGGGEEVEGGEGEGGGEEVEEGGEGGEGEGVITTLSFFNMSICFIEEFSFSRWSHFSYISITKQFKPSNPHFIRQ